jgi:hypothetical protein
MTLQVLLGGVYNYISMVIKKCYLLKSFKTELIKSGDWYRIKNVDYNWDLIGLLFVVRVCVIE